MPMPQKLPPKLVKWGFFILGFCLTLFGVRLIVFSQFGTNSADLVSVALFQLFGISLGFWANIISVSALLLGSILNKRLPPIISVVLSFTSGLLLDLYSFLLFDRLDTAAFSAFALLLCFFVGFLCMGLGIGSYLVPNIGAAAMELLTLAVMATLEISLFKARMLLDFAMAILVFFLGGPLGLGTLLMMFGLGPLIQFFHGSSRKLYVKLGGSLYV